MGRRDRELAERLKAKNSGYESASEKAARRRRERAEENRRQSMAASEATSPVRHDTDIDWADVSDRVRATPESQKRRSPMTRFFGARRAEDEAEKNGWNN